MPLGEELDDLARSVLVRRARPETWIPVPLQLVLALAAAVTGPVTFPLIALVVFAGSWRAAVARRRVAASVAASLALGPAERTFPVSVYDIHDPVPGIPDFVGVLVAGPEMRLVLQPYCEPGGRVPVTFAAPRTIPLPAGRTEVSEEGVLPGHLPRGRLLLGPGSLLRLFHEGSFGLFGPARAERRAFAASLVAHATQPAPLATAFRPGPLRLYRRSACWELALAGVLVAVSLIAVPSFGRALHFDPRWVDLAGPTGALLALAGLSLLARWRDQRFARVVLAERWLVHDAVHPRLHVWEEVTAFDDGDADVVFLRRRPPRPALAVPTPDEHTRTAVLAVLDRKGIRRVES